MAQLLINDRTYTVDADPSTPLLWVIRERLQPNLVPVSCSRSRMTHRSGVEGSASTV